MSYSPLLCTTLATAMFTALLATVELTSLHLVRIIRPIVNYRRPSGRCLRFRAPRFIVQSLQQRGAQSSNNRTGGAPLLIRRIC